MARSPKTLEMGMRPPLEPQPKILTQEEKDERRRRASLGMLTGPVAERLAEAIVDVAEGGDSVILETTTHRLEVTVTAK